MCTMNDLKKMALNRLDKLGVAAIGFLFAGYVYMDLQDNNKSMQDIIRDQTKSMTEVTEVLRQLTNKVESISK